MIESLSVGVFRERVRVNVDCEKEKPCLSELFAPGQEKFATYHLRYFSCVNDGVGLY